MKCILFFDTSLYSLFPVAFVGTEQKSNTRLAIKNIIRSSFSRNRFEVRKCKPKVFHDLFD